MELSISDDGEVWLVAASKADDSHFGGADGKPFLFRLDTPATARFVRIRSIAEEFLHLDEVEVYGTVVTA
jgi:hypothetical protein